MGCATRGGPVAAGVLANLIGPDGLIVIAVVVIVLLFGGSKLPELARGLGSASHEFKKGMAEGEESSKAADAAKTAEAAKDSEAPKDSSGS
jgi:sec-independent protein translocase protein TatA